MQEAIYQTMEEIVQALKAVTAELHLQHADGQASGAGATCREESCRALGRLEAQVDSLRRALGIASFRSRGF